MQIIDINKVGKTTTTIIAMADIFYNYMEENMVFSGDIEWEK